MLHSILMSARLPQRIGSGHPGRRCRWLAHIVRAPPVAHHFHQVRSSMCRVCVIYLEHFPHDVFMIEHPQPRVSLAALTLTISNGVQLLRRARNHVANYHLRYEDSSVEDNKDRLRQLILLSENLARHRDAPYTSDFQNLRHQFISYLREVQEGCISCEESE